MANYLVTGGAGFIGSHLCEALLQNGHRVIAIDDLSTGQWSNIQHLNSHQNFHFVRETILNSLVLDRIASESDIIVHLAAAVGVKLIVEDPVHTINTNILGTERVLTTANRYGCKVLLASTSEVYGKNTKIPFKEEDDCVLGATVHNRWSYAASKAVDEFLGLAFNQQFNLPVVIMRFFNAIGPRQTGKYGMVVPRFVRWALRGEPLQVYGEGNQSRCFMDISDTVRGIIALAENSEALGQVFNIGSEEEISINQLAKLIIELTKSSSSLRHIPYDEAYAPGFEDLQRRVPSIEKIRRLVGFTPQVSLRDALLRIIDHEKATL